MKQHKKTGAEYVLTIQESFYFIQYKLFQNVSYLKSKTKNFPCLTQQQTKKRKFFLCYPLVVTFSGLKPQEKCIYLYIYIFHYQNIFVTICNIKI